MTNLIKVKYYNGNTERGIYIIVDAWLRIDSITSIQRVEFPSEIQYNAPMYGVTVAKGVFIVNERDKNRIINTIEGQDES